MKLYLYSIAAGVMVGVIYSLINVRSPAPPLIALLGLLGMLFGEQIIPVGKQVLAGSALAAAWRDQRCTSHVFGMLPGRQVDEAMLPDHQGDEASTSMAKPSEKCS